MASAFQLLCGNQQPHEAAAAANRRVVPHDDRLRAVSIRRDADIGGGGGSTGPVDQVPADLHGVGDIGTAVDRPAIAQGQVILSGATLDGGRGEQGRQLVLLGF